MRRARELALGFLLCAGRRTVAGAIVARGRQRQDWCADYRLFSRLRMRPEAAFAQARHAAAARLGPCDPFLAVLDDTLLRRRGRRMPHARWCHDTQGPPFAHQIVWAQRAVETCALVPDGSGGMRAIAIGLELLEAPARLPRNATAEQLRQARGERRGKAAPAAAARAIAALRRDLDGDGGARRALVVAVDGGYTNRTVFRDVPERAVLVGRLRKDAALFAPPPPRAPGQRGKPRLYGEPLPRPAEMLKDERLPWHAAHAFAAGREREFRYKTIARARWSGTGGRDVRIVAVRALDRSHDTGRRLYFAHDAYLLCTDPDMPVEQLLAAYVSRWEIEVAFREQKTEFGLGEPQVRTQPACVAQFQALLHALVHLAALAAGPKALPLPAWREPPRRLAFGQILAIARHEATLSWPRSDTTPPAGSKTRFAPHPPPQANPPIIHHGMANAQVYARW